MSCVLLDSEGRLILASDLATVLLAGIDLADAADLGVIETAVAHRKARLTRTAPVWGSEDFGQTRPEFDVVGRAG